MRLEAKVAKRKGQNQQKGTLIYTQICKRLEQSIWQSHIRPKCHYDDRSQSYNSGLQYPHLHGPVHTPDNNRWDTPPI